MDPSEFPTSVSIVLLMLVLASAIELALPMFARPSAQRRRVATNLGLTALTLTLNGALTWIASGVALALSLQGPGLMTRLGIPTVVQIVGGFVVLDFCFGYLAHRALHRSPFLWSAHRVHHSDPFVDATTTLRNHPIEGFCRFLFLIVPIWTLGVPAEAVALQRLLTAINGMLEHANIRLWPPLDRALSLVWVTPGMHKVHHSRVPLETDSNYGNILSIYDRVFRTFTPTDRARSVRYGLDDVDPVEAASLPKLLALPFRPSAQSSGAAVVGATVRR
jgi:sterol desaturase/sphingolipid hydroxylase (fatty acid hydroxylase superfamily)